MVHIFSCVCAFRLFLFWDIMDKTAVKSCISHLVDLCPHLKKKSMSGIVFSLGWAYISFGR